MDWVVIFCITLHLIHTAIPQILFLLITKYFRFSMLPVSKIQAFDWFGTWNDLCTFTASFHCSVHIFTELILQNRVMSTDIDSTWAFAHWLYMLMRQIYSNIGSDWEIIVTSFVQKNMWNPSKSLTKTTHRCKIWINSKTLFAKILHKHYELKWSALKTRKVFQRNNLSKTDRVFQRNLKYCQTIIIFK